MIIDRRKTAAALLAAIMALTLASCGGADSTGSNDDSKDATTAAAAADGESKTEAETTAAADSTEPAAAETTAPADEEPDAPMPDENPPAEPELKSPELKEIGKIDGKDINFYGDLLLFRGDSEENIECLDYMGKPIADGGVPLVEKLDSCGVYAFCKVKDGVVYEGLMDAEGNIIIDADQGVGIYRDIGSSRFLKAYFPEGETDNKDEAIYYVTSNQFSFMPKDSDTLYKGTVKIFDLETKKFLENTAVKFDPNVFAHGDIVRFYDADSNNVHVNANDEKLDIAGNMTITGNKFIMASKDGKNVAYDHSMNKLFSTDLYIFGLDGSSYYYRARNNDTGLDGVISEMGRTIIEPKYKSVFGLNENYFTYTTDDKVGLLKADGTEITKDEYTYISEAAPGYFNGKRASDGVSVLFDKTGKVIFEENGEDKLYSLRDGAPCAMIGDEYYYLVFSTGELSLKLPTTGTGFGNNILYSYKNQALYDLTTGKTLLEGFDKAYTAYGKYIYVLNGDEITVYEVV